MLHGKKLNAVLNRAPYFNSVTKINKDGNELSGGCLPNAFNGYFVNLVKRGISTNALNTFKFRSDETFFCAR